MKIASKRNQYYSINNPTEKNYGTGNVCFDINQLAKFDKDFLFHQVIDGVEYIKVLPKEWVRDHMLPMYGTRKSNNPLIPDTKYVFYILKVEEILNY